jgi:hypothetical protein
LLEFWFSVLSVNSEQPGPTSDTSETFCRGEAPTNAKLWRFLRKERPEILHLKVLSRELEPLGVTSGNDRPRRQGLFLGNRFNRINPSSDVDTYTSRWLQLPSPDTGSGSRPDDREGSAVSARPPRRPNRSQWPECTQSTARKVR